MGKILSEDQVRDTAKKILGFDDIETEVEQGTGQITTFNMLGFGGVSDKPDGWYLPYDRSRVAIILETKSSKEDINLKKWENELLKNIAIVETKYTKVIGILWNGIEQKIFKNHDEVLGISKVLQKKEYYISLFTSKKLDKQHIYEVTQRINNNLHFNFGMTDLQDRMIFTACALVAQRYFSIPGLKSLKSMGYNTFKNWIFDSLSKAIVADKRQNDKLEVLLDTYSIIKISIENQDAINNFIDDVCEISELVNSDYWNGEDVMAIFFNEFNRYRGKAQAGQVFTPDHVTSFMYRLIDVDMNDRVLDATCGSGAFLVKAMCNMMKEAGGVKTQKAAMIKSEQLFGIEMFNKIFALACANMMIHKDGKTNLAQLDTRNDEACEWIKEKNITKVLMNPPYERKYGCMKIVKNVMDSVPKGTKCAFILPDKKLEKAGGKKLLKDHTLKTIVKMPENLFFGVGITTSIFIFETGRPQNGQNIIGYYVEDDGLETVKNKGRQDIRNKWESKENYWIKAIHDGNDYMYNTRQIIDPKKHLSYQMPEENVEILERDFTKTVLDYTLFEKNVDSKEFMERILDSVIYDSQISEEKNDITIMIKKVEKDE